MKSSPGIKPRPGAFVPLALGLLCGAVVFSLQPGRAAGERFEVSQSTARLPEVGVVTNIVVLTETCETTFSPPRGAAVQTETASRKIKVLPIDRNSSFALQFTSNSPALLSSVGLPELQRQVEGRYAGAQVIAGPTCFTGAGAGPSFDIEQSTAYHSSLTTRLAFVPLPDGTLEVAMTAATSNFTAQRYVFAGFLGSVHVKSPILPAGGRTTIGY